MTPPAYDLAERLWSLAPWKRIPEGHLIALEDPFTGERHHISLMGSQGEHCSLALYLGAEGRQRLNLLQAVDDLPREDLMALILDTPQLQCSFSQRGGLFKSELAAIKAAGRKFRGDGWPVFRVFRPGWCPTRAIGAEIDLLVTAIEQVLEIVPLLEIGEETLRHQNGKWEILTRRCIDGTWQSVWTPDDSSLYAPPSPPPSELLVERVRRHSRRIDLDVCLRLLPNPVGPSRENSFFPYILLVVEPQSQLVLGVEVLSVDGQTHEQLLASVPDRLLRICDRNSICPAVLRVTSPITAALLGLTAEALGIPLYLGGDLPALEDAFGSMLSSMPR
jgi:hypothetical protein